jgi:hypothetical protein
MAVSSAESARTKSSHDREREILFIILLKASIASFLHANQDWYVDQTSSLHGYVHGA